MKKGFTLIELLAVIVILAIILVIAVPQVLKVIANSKKDSFSSSAMLVAKSVEQNVVTDDTRPTTVDCMINYGLNSNDYESCTAKISYGDTDIIVSVDIVGKGKFEGLTVGATSSNSHVIDDTNTQNLSTVLLATVGTKDVDVNKYNGNGLYKWGSKYIYRGGMTKTNANGLATVDYATDTDSGSEVSNYIKVPWETYATGEDCTSTTNKCYRIISIDADGSITIVRDKKVSDQVFDSTINTAARTFYNNYTPAYGYNDLLVNIPTTGHPEEYRAYSEMYTYLYGSNGYENTTMKLYTSILQPLNICLNKANNYIGVNSTLYATTTRIKDTCEVSGKPYITIVDTLKNKYVRLLYMEEYLNTSLEGTCTQDYQYQCIFL
jgi:type IV pilus assembly protein PilA